MSTHPSEMFSRSILIVAHPDDETLWFSSIVDKVDEILFCFSDYPPLPSLGSGRKKVLDSYPLDNISSLEIEESGSFSGADWNTPAESPWGMAITQSRQIKQRYQDNYPLLEKLLAEKLRRYSNVFTHNPWGEYGHEDHVQVYRAVENLQKQLSFQLWFSNYVSNRSAKLMFSYISGFDNEYVSLPTNPELAERIANNYKKHNCWTWYDDYRWFDRESFINSSYIGNAKKNYGHIFPVNMLKTDFPPRPEKEPHKFSLILKKIQRKLHNRIQER